MKKVVVLSGAGISAESGIATFRGADGLWEGHDVTAVASPEGWERDPELVLDFYNKRRNAIRKAKPNRGHLVLAELQDDYDVEIITQNIDDLHERAGSRNVLHLHGQINQSRSTKNPGLVYEIDGDELNIGDCCELGSQLRPNVVWFGEMVPAMEKAMELASKADYFIVVGTSLLVYPAAGLLDFVSYDVPRFIVDPSMPNVRTAPLLHLIEEPAGTGLEKVRKMMREL
ncbi:MAG: NAD-dependent deacylase [Cyclobacteriaceae bacterium]